MRKGIIVLSLLLILSISFTACSTAKNTNDDIDSEYAAYTAYIDASGVDGLGDRVDAAYRYSYMKEADIPTPQSTTLSVKIMGSDYTANYARKNMWSVFEPAYIYKTEAGEEITVDLSGNVVGFETASFNSLFHTAADANNCLTSEEALTKATEYLSQIFGSQFAAKYSGKLPDVWANSIRVRFRRIDTGFDAYNTFDKVVITINSDDGDFFGYEAYNVGKYENKKIPNDFNDSKIKGIIDKSLTDSKANIELSSETKNLIILPDGRLACRTCFRINDNGIVGE